MPEIGFPDIADTDPIVASDESNSYLLYELEVDWQWESGISQQPVAAVGADAAMIRLTGDWGRQVVRFTALRQGDWPQLPTADPTDTNRVFLEGSIRMMGPKPGAGGQLLFAVKGKLVFGLSRPVTTATGFPGLKIPLVALPKESSALYSSFFSDLLV